MARRKGGGLMADNDKPKSGDDHTPPPEQKPAPPATTTDAANAIFTADVMRTLVQLQATIDGIEQRAKETGATTAEHAEQLADLTASMVALTQQLAALANAPAKSAPAGPLIPVKRGDTVDQFGPVDGQLFRYERATGRWSVDGEPATK